MAIVYATVRAVMGKERHDFFFCVKSVDDNSRVRIDMKVSLALLQAPWI